MADNRYYYFKDAKGNRHTVDKTAYDKDPMGFAKAFPGARMEVIDRKTGRRGDVSVKDASRVGDFGAHLFTGRTITRGKGKPNSSALGRAQQSVAQEKWGGGVVTHENTTASENVSAPKRNAVTLDDWNGGTTGKESELVKGLRAADMIRKRDEEQMPIDYTKPGAVKQMVGGARRAQKSLERRMEQAGQEAGRNAEGEIRRRNAPAFDLGNEDVNNNIVKTRGQLEKEMEESAATIADKNFADTFANMIAGERQAAEKRGFDAYLQRTVFSATPMGSTLLGTIAYNAERDPAKLQQNLLNTLGKNMESMLSDPNVAQKVVTESKRLGVDPEDYVKTALMPSIQNKLMSEYDKTELKEWMPRNTFVDIIDGLGDGFQVGSILDAALTKAQRQYRQRAIIATQNGENPYYQRDKYGVTEGVRSALSLASDVIGPGGGVLGGIGKGVGAASAKVFGNEVKTIARMANMSKLQRMFKPSILMRGAAETGANFGIYEGLKGAQSYSSTTDDVKLGEMLENSAVSAAHGAVSGATLGVVGKMLGGLGYNVGIKGPMGVDPNFGKNMLKGLGMKGVQIIGEGTAFYAGGNFNNALSGADTDWSAGNLLSNIMAAGIYKIVSTHTATGAANMLTPEKGQSYGGSVAVKFGTALYKAAMAPSAQGKAFAFTPDEKQQLFASGDKAGLPGKEGSFGRQDILTWAERVMKATPVGKEDKSGNVKVAREYYESVMQDPNVSWDAKMKLNALLGIAPATRPEMDMRTYTIEDGKRYVNEYAKDGTLLSKRSYKNMEQREAIEYDLMMQKENQRMLNGLGYILNRDCSRMDLQMEFLRQHDYDFDNPDSPRNQAIMDDMLGNNKTLTLKRGRTLHDEWLDFVSENGITTKLIKDIADAHGLSVEEMFKIVNKEPIKRTEEEQRACVELRKALNNIVYEDGMPHADQADSDGKDVVEENNLGTENPNNEAVAEVLNNMNNAEKAFNAALESNDVLKQEYERLAKEGLSEPQIYMELINSGLTQEQLVPFADYINTKAKAVGMYRGTEQKIAETVQKHVEQWSYKGELNGEKQEGGQMLFVKDNNGRLLIVGAGDVAFDSEGRARENVGDMLSVLDPNTKEMDFVSKKDVQLDHVEKTEDYAKNYQEMLEVKNSEVYAQNEQQKQMENAAGGVSPEGGKPNGEEGVKYSYTLGEKKAGNGEPFYQDESGNIDLATIPDEVFEGIGYTKAPFRLTPSMIKHMLDRHNKELGFKDEGEAINFVVDVMNNFDHVRLGYDGALVFSIENGRKRTGKRAVTVLINSDNGEFYGLKTSGYEGIKGLEKRPLLWERGANETSSTDAASASVTTSKGPISGGQSGSASHQGNDLHDKDSNNSPNGNGNKETLTFADGSPVPMIKDSKNRETADYSQMTPEQGAEWIKTRFGENADSFVDGRIKRAEKAVKDAEKMKVDMSGEEEDVAEALAARKAAIESAEKELAYFTAVKNVMNQAKAAEAAAGGEGATGNRYEQWRKDGYHIGEGGVRYDRQKKEDMTGVYGKDVKVDFTPTVGVNGRAKVVEVDSVQASHVNGQVNPMHFGPDWQPKDRTDNASKAGQDKALANFDPEKITGDGNAFIGSSPSVNERHEVIQGNNRAEILRRLYDEQPEKAAQYKQWLIDHAEEYGLDAAEIAKMKKPILVNELPVDDAKALELGQYRASDFESGGKELPRASVVINRLGDKMQSVANIMLSQGSLPEDAKMSDLVSQNASKVLDYLVKEGVVSATEEQTLRKDATAMRQWMEELLKTGLFEGDKETEAAFNQLPDNARRAVLATYLRDAKSADEAKIKRNLQRSFEAYNEMMNNPAFVNAKNVADARAAVAAEIERGNNSLLGEEPIRERFSNFELELAALYKGLKDQKTLTGLLNRYFDAVQGDKATGKQLEIGQEPREAISKDEALKEVFGLHESKPAETQNQVDKAVKRIATEITKKTGIEVVTDEKEAEALKRGLQIDNSVKEFRTKDGEVYGFTDGEKIYLDTRKMKPETPLHEYAHLWCDMLRRVNPKEWESVKKLFDKVEGLKEEVQKLYPELEGDALYEEMITTYSGREGTKKLEDVVRKLAAEEGKSVTESAKAQGFLEKVKEALTKYWKGVADVLGIHFTTAEEVADKVLADWAKGVDPRESEKGKVKSEESESVVTPKGDKKGDIKDATAPKGDKTKEEPSKTNPLAWLAHTAEMYKDEQVQKAKEELAKAKESGDASDIKRATADMKQAMETKLRGNGIGLVERRRIIGRELGKILGEEAGKTEAEKIDKPWEQMDLEEREAVSSKNPLTETEINELTSEENRELIPAALAYLRGDKGNIINAISYFKIWNDVRSRHENVPDNSGTKDGTQLDAPNTGGSQELGLGRGREGGGPNGPVDRTDGERTTPGERESGTGGENDTPVSTGKPRVDKGEGNTPGMDAVSAGSTDTRGGGGAGNEGNVPKRGGQGGDNRPLDPNAGRKPAAKQGTHFPDSTSERLKQERAEYEQKKKDFWERWKKAGQGYMKISLTPFKALNLSPEQIEMLPELFKMHLNGAVLKIKEGIYKFNEWKAAMRAEEGEELKMIGLSDDDIDRFIEDYWNTPYQMDGETHTIGEWAGIHGNEKLRNKLSEPLNDKYQRQVDAEPIKVKIGDKKNIEETLPYLLPQQQEDVLKAETQFFGEEHADREHAYGKGYMFTNGTGTGKTFTGLGIAKRLVKQGKGRILIVTPSQKKVSDWIKDGRNLNMEIRDLDSIAKERGTTATTESGEGVVITTFANFGVNKKLLEENWDAVIYDESHRIMENKKGTETARSMQHYMVTNRDENHCFLRLQEINKDYQKVKDLGERFDAERDKEVKRIQDEYKASHPSATARDVAYATSKMLPKERNGFTPGDYASFPKLGEIHAEFVNALRHYTNEVKPKLEAQAKNEWKDTKTIFLSATPFNTRENLDYVEGYIFKYPEGEKAGRMSGRTQFYLDHFGAAYKYRYNRLEQSTSNPEAVAKQEIEFSDYLQHTLGTMSGRIIDSPYDYSRDFPTVSPDHAERFNQAVQEAIGGHGVLADAYRKTIGDYTYGSALFETMKVANIIERIKAHLDAGRKVVIFHRRVESKEPLKPPFALMLDRANFSISLMNPGEEKNEAIQAVRAFRKKYADLLKWEQTLDYSMPREQIAKVFGKDNVLFFSGKESSKVKDKAVDTFNDDNSGKNIIVIQEASGKEGISLHDKTGEHQRVCITLALPQSPITALQIEGRTYRIGNKSNAIFEYPILGLNSEMMLFGQKFNNQVSTTENLALGSQARSLRDSFANGILEHSGVVPIDQQGVGGKEFDAPKDQSTDGFDNAVLDYYSNQKLNSRNREGVDYFPTPEPLGYKMMEWANMGEGDTVMEPSAGHGAIARYAPKGNQMVAIEPSQSLFAKLQLKAGGLGRKFVNTIFENYDISNKHDVVVMNPPFGTAGATAIAHLGKAFKHLEEGGRVVAIIPRGSTDKKFEKWINGEKTAVMRAEVELPDIVFKQAGTKVVCRVVVVDKISNEAMRAKAGSVEKVNLGGHYDKIEDFFEDLRDIEMPDRIIDTNTIMQKKSKQTAKDLKELKDVTVNLNEHGINVHVRGDRNDYSIMFDLGEYNAEQRKSILSGTYERFEEYERYTRDETSQAVIAELKKLTCKLAGMTVEEMQRYLKKQNDGESVMENIAHSAEVYNNAKKIRFQKAPKEEQSEELYLSLQNKKGKEYYDTVTELAERMAGRTGRKEKSVSERQSQPRETSVGRNTERIVGRPKSIVHCAAEIIAADTERSYGNGGLQQFERGLERGKKDALVPREKSSQSEVLSADVWENRVSDPVEREISKRIEDWAKQTNHWFDWRSLRTKYDRTKQLGDGTEAESDVFLSKDGETVLKVVRNPHALYTSLLGKLNSIALHNKLFGDVGQTIIGITRTTETDALGKDVSTIGLLIEQPFVEGKPVADMFNNYGEEIAYIDKTMTDLGFKPEKWADNGGFFNGEPETVWMKGDVIVYDTHGNNIFIDKNGKPRLIDCGIETYKEYAKRHTIYDSAKAREAEYENAVRAVKSKIRLLEKEVLNEERIIAMLRDNRREDNADKIDGFINYHKEKIAELKHNIRINAQAIQKPNSVHYRTEASLGLSKPTEPVEGRIAETVEKVSKQTGGKVKMVNSVDEIENPKVRKDIENGKQVTGWYDEKTGEVHLYMPNIHDTYTAEKTVWHETVGHKGMRGLLGDKFNDYMRSLWMDLDNPINAELRAYVKEKMNMNHLGFYDAIEEFIAKSAEDGKGEPGFWNYIKNKVTDALHEIGYRVSPNVKDVKYMLWLAKNVQKHGDSPLWKMRAEAVRWKIEHEKTEYTKIEGGELYDNDGKSHDFEGMSREEWLEATDGEIHYRTAPNAATALDRYHHALDRHSYMATEAFMDNMLSLKKLMEAIDPSIRKIEDVNSSMNPYLMQNITEGMMSDKSKLFEIRYMDPLSKAMSSVLDSFDGKKVEDRIRNFNLYMIRKHGLERNRVLFVRDWIREERKGKSEESDSVDALETAWKDERSDLRKKLDSGQIDLKEYYRQMDEWIVQNLDKAFKAEEHDYSGMHGLQGIDDMKSPYDDAGAIDDVMSQEASMEGMKQGSVADFWKKVKAATDYSVNSDYESGLISQITHYGVLDMFDWYVPLRKFDEATAEDVYGYVTEMGDPSNYIGTTLMNAKGRKSLSNVEILAQIGLMGNRAIRNGGQNTIKQAFARFVRNSGEQNLVKETKVWVEKTGTDLNGNDIWEEAYPHIPEGASADDVASIVDAFETDMRTKQAKGEAKSLSNGTDIGFKFQRAKDKSQHFVDVKIAGRTHRFVVLGNPRAAQALNGMLENGKASKKWLQTVTRWMAMASTSWSPEFVMRNIVRDMEFASSHVAAKEGGRYLAKWSRYYGELNPLNMFYNEGAGSLKSMKMKDFKNGVGFGLYARYREGTLGNSKMERYFKEFMENGGETGFVQLFSMLDMEKSYKSIVEKESAKGAKKVMVNAVEVLKKLGKNVENLNEVAENMARFATYCTSRDLGRSAARSAYDAKEVSTNFNRHGSGDAIKSFKNGEMGDWQKARRNTYGFVAGYLRNYSMFFNAGIQSTNLLFKNIKRAPVGTTVAMTSAPFALALIMAAVNNAIIQNEDDKDRGNVKDPYGELPDYIRRNNLCIYVGNNKFVTVPLAIELRAFYSLGDLAAGQTFAKNVKSQRNMAMDAVGCMSQLFPVMDFLNNPNYEKSLENGVGMTIEGLAPTAIVPFIEWWLNNDWKGAPIRRTGDKTELNPAWQNAYNNVPARLVDLNKWVNAKTNNIAPGNPEMKGNEVLDWATDPSMLNHFFGSWSGGMGTFTQRTAGLGAKATTGKTDEIEVGDVPFLRSLFYTPREQSSMGTKAKWYNYKEEMEQTIANNDKLKSKNVPTMKRIENAAALEKFEGSPEQRKVNIIKNAEKRMRHWNTMRKKWADDKKQVDFANHNIEMIMKEAVEDLDRIE